MRFYQRVTGQPAPAALVAAQQRADLNEQQHEGRDPALVPADREPPPSTSATAQSLDKALADDTWFWGGCPSGLPIYPDPSIYRIQEWRRVTGTGTMQDDDIYSSRARVMNLQGPTIRATFKVRPWYTWSGGLYIDLAPGQYYEFVSGHINNRDYDAKLSVAWGQTSVWDACMYSQYNR